jgi:tRNA threonylcarbamoyladenosine biosynthesis protein TsaB
MKEYVLSVDCCSEWTTLGLAENGTVRGEVNIDAGKKQSAILPDLLRAFLDAFSLVVEDISMFGVVAGPGSFTGIKVGISFVTFLAWAGKKPVIPLSSLECMAFGKIGRNEGIAAPLLWAGGGKVYGSLFRTGKEGCAPKRLCAAGAYTPDGFLDAISASGCDAGDILWVTDRPEKTAPLFPSFGDRFEKFIPGGALTAELTLRRRDRALTPAEVRANYLRDPDLG